MLISYGLPVTFRGLRAELHVIRNDGYCYGRVIAGDGQQFDVWPSDDEDLYDCGDVEALERFEEMLGDEACVSPAITWI